MIFKNAQVRAFTKPFNYQLEELNKLLSGCKFTPLEEKQVVSCGWVNPIGAIAPVGDDYFLASTNGVYLLKYYIEKKDIKASTIKRKLKILEDEKFEKESRGLTKREKIEASEQIVEDLLPHAQTIEKAVYAYISPKDNVLVVNTTTDTDLENVCALLRKSIGSFPCTIVSKYLLGEESKGEESVASVFTALLVGEKELPKQLLIGDSCTTVSAEGGKAKSTFKEQDIQTDEIKEFINNCGMEVKDLSFILYEKDYDNREVIMSFTVNKDLDLKSINIFDHVLLENPFSDAEEGAELNLFEGDFLISVKYINLAFETIHKIFKTSAKACIDESLGDWDSVCSNLEKITNYFSVQMLQIVEDDVDTLFEEAKQFIIDSNSFSISALQRRFRIGYNRAARLVQVVKVGGVELNGK